MRLFVTGLAAFALTSGAFAGGDGDCLWDNDLEPDGFNARAVSPPVFPDIRVADDFTVTDDLGWAIRDFHCTVVEDAGWVPSGRIEVTFYADGGGCPGPAIAQRLVPVERMATGGQLFDRDVYEYWAFFAPIELGPRRYWVGHRDPLGAGAGTNYWVTSSGGEGETSPGCFSLDAGATWVTEGPDWDHAFKITGAINCTPCKGDINGDCVVSFDDLLQVLSAWGPCPGPTSCNDPPACPAATCGPQEECFCFMTFEGDRDCHLDFSCSNPECPGGSGDCPTGWSCYVETCCGVPVCAPDEDLCQNGAAPRPVSVLSGPTASGLKK